MRFVVALLLLGSLARAGEQGAACKSDRDCGAPLSCKKTSGAPRCEIVCDDQTKCPAEQRCVKDHGARFCRSINDGVDL